MPEGIIATVDGAFATIDFVDRSLRGPALNTLIEGGGPGIIQTLTRSGPRVQYRVPVGNATAAGLLDGDEGPAADPPVHDTGAAAALAAAQAAQIVQGAVTRPDMPTSANAYVGVTTAAQERAMAPSPAPAWASGGYGGTNASQTPTSAELIEYLKEHGAWSAQAVDGAPDPEMFGATAFQVNAALAEIYSGDPNAPGAVPIEGGESLGEYTANPVVQDPTAVNGLADGFTEQTAEPVTQAWPDGEPSDKWTRDELNAYATSLGVEDAESLANKTEVLTAIEQKLAEPK